jgi:hypothetical protein
MFQKRLYPDDQFHPPMDLRIIIRSNPIAGTQQGRCSLKAKEVEVNQVDLMYGIDT